MTREEAIKLVKRIKGAMVFTEEDKEALETLIPELRESEDERVRKAIFKALSKKEARDVLLAEGVYVSDALAYLEKQKPSFRQIHDGIMWDNGLRTGIELGKRKGREPVMIIQWTGKNLKEVIDFTGKSPKFGEWFKSWEDFENYVHSHDDILKLFCEDGSHYEVPAGAWIVKTPDGHNIPSRFRFVQKPVECIEFDNEFKKQVSHLLASVLNKDWDYDKGSVEYAAQQLLGYAKHEIQPVGWSEEDIRNLNNIIWLCENCIGGYETTWIPSQAAEIKDLINRVLKSPRPQQKDDFDSLQKDFHSHNEAFEAGREFERGRKPHWRPGEEEVRTLERALFFLADKGFNDKDGHLESIHNNIKEL